MVRTNTSATVEDNKPAVEVASIRELDALGSGLAELSKRLRWLKTSLVQLVNLVGVVLERGYGLEYNDEDIKILATGDAGENGRWCVLLETAYDATQRDLAKVFELQQSLLKSFAELPPAIVAKLPTKNGSPWRSFYLRECLDILDEWPQEVQSAIPYLESEIDVPGLISAMRPRGPRPGFPLHEHFDRFGLILEDAVREIHSLRFENAATTLTAAAEITEFDAEATDKTQDNNPKPIKPTPDTLVVIRLIEKGKSNDEVQKLLKEKHNLEKGIPAIRQIRSRLRRGPLQPVNRDTL